LIDNPSSPVPLESILCTEELEKRPARPPDFEKEYRAIIAMTKELADSPHTILQTLAETILSLLDCGSAGISLLTKDGGTRFYWPAIAGTWKPHVGGGTPRNFGPCGDVLDQNTPLLFKKLERRYTYFEPVTPPVEEALLVPFYIEGKAVGTIWVVSHDTSRKFDLEDLRRLQNLAQFASAAYKAVISVETSEQLVAIVESSDDAIVSKNLDGIIGSWNKSAERLFGYTAAEAIGQHITLIIPSARRHEETEILERLRRGERVDHFETVRVRKDGSPIDISLTISPVKDSAGRVIGASKVARDISEKKRLEEARREAELSVHQLQAQDQERRRIARELHDSVGQVLAAISINLAMVMGEKDKLSAAASASAEEVGTMVERASAEVRTVSYLLHPPMLDEIGLETALRWYVDGFAERSKIKIAVEVERGLPRLSQNAELSLFRIVQECLTNIHRHSGSSTAFVRLSSAHEKIELEIRDEGKGLDQEIQSKVNSGRSVGVGFRGMRERVRLIGASLNVRSDEHGTSVLVTLPLEKQAAANSSL
jgi:PAS domain S-box-containing protein